MRETKRIKKFLQKSGVFKNKKIYIRKNLAQKENTL